MLEHPRRAPGTGALSCLLILALLATPTLTSAAPPDAMSGSEGPAEAPATAPPALAQPTSPAQPAPPTPTQGADVEDRAPGRKLGRLPEYDAFEIDLVLDLSIMMAALGFGIFSEVSIQNGELAAQEPLGVDRLTLIDRWVVENATAEDLGDSTSAILSDVALGVAAGYALLDSILVASEHSWLDGGVNFFLYAEGVLLNWAIVNTAKLAVRRPRPNAYVERRLGREFEPSTNDSLSFYSGHTAITAGLCATATYLAFRRDPEGWRGWVTLSVGTALTALVATQRVASLNHFPSDVTAGAFFGAGIGVLVPYFHRVAAPRMRLGPLAAPHGVYGDTLGFSFDYTY